jgi:hypothetical protein
VSSSANIPGDAVSDPFYDPTPVEPDQLYQGEILTDVPIFLMPKPSRWLLIRTASGRRVDEALKYGATGGTVKVLDSNQTGITWYGDGLGDFAMGVLDKRPVLVLSQTCDVQSKDFLQVAPIFPASEDVAALDRLRGGMMYSAFWMQSHAPEIPTESYADFELIQSVHKTYLRRIQQKQHFRLNADRTRKLQSAITRYFGRPNSYDVKTDRAPVSGTYLCIRCFYMDACVSSSSLDKGSPFESCITCQGTQWILKGR